MQTVSISLCVCVRDFLACCELPKPFENPFLQWGNPKLQNFSLTEKEIKVHSCSSWCAENSLSVCPILHPIPQTAPAPTTMQSQTAGGKVQTWTLPGDSGDVFALTRSRPFGHTWSRGDLAVVRSCTRPKSRLAAKTLQRLKKRRKKNHPLPQMKSRRDSRFLLGPLDVTTFSPLVSDLDLVLCHALIVFEQVD